MNSEYVSQPASQSSSRMQSPVVYNPKLPWTYKFQKFINKIPLAIRYGLTGSEDLRSRFARSCYWSTRY